MHRDLVRQRSVRGAARVLGAAALLTIGAGGAAAQDAPLKIAVVDIDFIAAQSPAGKALAGEIAALQQQYQSELAARQTQVEAIQTRIAAVDSADVARQRELQREYQDALTSFQRYQQDVQAQAQSYRNSGLQRVRETIGPAIEAIMREEGFDLILNAGNPGVVMHSERVDITETVLARLEAGGGD